MQTSIPFCEKRRKNPWKVVFVEPEVKTVNPVIVEFLMLACFSYGTFLTSTAVNKCSPNPCKNMGACSEFEDDYVCNCPQGFKGKTCEGTFIYETHRRYIRQNQSWWLLMRQRYSLSSSLTTLVWRWRQRNLQKKSCAALLSPWFAFLTCCLSFPSRTYSPWLLELASTVSPQTILYGQRFGWKTVDKMEKVPEVPIERFLYCSIKRVHETTDYFR